MVLSLSCRRLHSLIRNSNYRLYSGGYVVLLPEIGPSLPDQPNPLLKDGLPNFEDITPEKCAHTLGKSLLDFEHEVFAVESRLKEAEQETQKDEEYSNGFIQKVVQPLQKPGITLDTTWGIVKTIFIVDEEKLPSSSYFKLHSRAHRAQYSRYSFQQIYKASKDCDLTQLSEEEQRVVERYQLEGHLNGLGLSKDDKESFDNLSKRLYLEKYDFNKRVQLCKGLFNNKISDQYVVKNFPIKLLESMAEDSNEPTIGPWLVPMDNYNYNKFLEYCPDDNLRLQVWKDKNSIASFELDVSELYNSVSLEKIRDIRLQQATLLGYPNFATMSMETKMAGTLENVLNVLELLRTYAFEAHIEEIDKLQEFASSSGFKKTLYIPDIPYWSRKQKKVLFNFENEEVREYFPFPKVVSGLIAFCEKMFGIRIELVENADTWHPDVTFYHVFEGDSVGPVASFFFDPFYRPEKLKCDPEEGWVVNIHPAYQTNGPRSVPLCSLIMNLPPPIYGKPSLLSYSEVQGLFGKFGKLLQQLLCTVAYTEVSGSSYVEWDAVNIVSDFMAFCLEDPKVLETVSGHYSNCEKLPVTNMKDVSAHMAGTALCSELYKSVLDLKLYSEKKFWPDIVKEVWPQHFVFPLDERRNQEPVNMTEIVTEYWAAAYFSHVWSKMIAADIYTAFQDENADEVAVGSRFRDTYLAFGGSCDPHEVFRRFRGRDPNPDSFIRYLRLRK